MLTDSTEVFSVPTSQFISYETKVWLPWFIKRYIFFKRIPRPPSIIERSELYENYEKKV